MRAAAAQITDSFILDTDLRKPARSVCDLRCVTLILNSTGKTNMTIRDPGIRMSSERRDGRHLRDSTTACFHEIIIIKTTSVFIEGDKTEP